MTYRAGLYALARRLAGAFACRYLFWALLVFSHGGSMGLVVTIALGIFIILLSLAFVVGHIEQNCGRYTDDSN
jgi:hypothetical protein